LRRKPARSRLRSVINKTQTEEQMMRAIALAQERNFPQLKLYFMVGHPTETDDDIQALIDSTRTARTYFKRRIAINATPFVPKAHTPFQWEAMTPAETLRSRQKTIHHALASQGVDVRADSPDWAEVQAVLSRGDRARGRGARRPPFRGADCALVLPGHGGVRARPAPLHRHLARRQLAALGCRPKRRERAVFSLRTAPGRPKQNGAELPPRQR
jgi:hypothetical protein